MTGILIGLIVPMFTASPHVTRAAAGAVFILLQFAAYLLVWIIDFLLLPELLFAVYAPSLLTLVILRLAQVGILFGLRDLLARGLWLLFKRLMDGQVVDTLVLMRGAPGAL
ncbi:MAG: hypothetical protein IPK19_08480 [Chloroflexi bacterium]|nr:hypothetical protein [Chloroflexota bacterium]